MKRIYQWFDARLGISDTLMPMLRHPVPREIAGPMGWWYVFGSASLTLFLLQILTGIGLALTYVPSAGQAYETLLYLNYQQPWGWFLRSLHYWSGSAMVVMVLVHMTQVFLHASYKYPRELTWVVGVFLLLGGPIIGADTLNRFFALHVFIIPAALILLLAVHLWLVLKKGISVPPKVGVLVDPATYDAEYEKETHERGVPFSAEPILKDIIFSALVVIVVVTIAALAGPKGPSAPPD